MGRWIIPIVALALVTISTLAFKLSDGREQLLYWGRKITQPNGWPHKWVMKLKHKLGTDEHR